jgi:hypothetical protein
MQMQRGDSPHQEGRRISSSYEQIIKSTRFSGFAETHKLISYRNQKVKLSNMKSDSAIDGAILKCCPDNETPDPDEPKMMKYDLNTCDEPGDTNAGKISYVNLNSASKKQLNPRVGSEEYQLPSPTR